MEQRPFVLFLCGSELILQSSVLTVLDFDEVNVTLENAFHNMQIRSYLLTPSNQSHISPLPQNTFLAQWNCKGVHGHVFYRCSVPVWIIFTLKLSNVLLLLTLPFAVISKKTKDTVHRRDYHHSQQKCRFQT